MWSIGHTENEDEAFEKFVKQALATSASVLPAQHRKIGTTEVEWRFVNATEATILASGPEYNVASWIVRQELEACGIPIFKIALDRDPNEVAFGTEEVGLAAKMAAWPDIEAKALRLIRAGNVAIQRNSWNKIVAHVIGDHGEYDCEIDRDDPNSRAITGWHCTCPWQQFAWQRTRQWKPLEGRPCAHVLATQWFARSAPLDDYDPNVHGPLPRGQKAAPAPTAPGGPAQMQLPFPGPGGPMPPAPPSQAPPFMAPPQGDQMSLFGPSNEPGIIPPYPFAPPANPGIIPVSVPGGRPGPTPGDPIQWPGGTLSKIAAKGDIFNNSDMVRVNEEIYGVMEGPRQGEHGDGQYRAIPKNSIGEVLGQDRTTGWVDVIVPLHDTGPLQPYHIRAWIEPEKLSPMPNIRKPGPFLKRAIEE